MEQDSIHVLILGAAMMGLLAGPVILGLIAVFRER
jgi:hypothetical protein